MDRLVEGLLSTGLTLTSFTITQNTHSMNHDGAVFVEQPLASLGSAKYDADVELPHLLLLFLYILI